MPTDAVFTPPSGPIRGWIDGSVARATGIPYAMSDRFEEPRPVADRDGTLVATDWSPACPQRPVPFLDAVLGGSVEGLEADEHCQRLSVTAPRDAGPGDGLPVMVWLHGGSYTSGAGDVPIMDPAPLVAEQRVIAVTVTYRLGLFGYLGGVAGKPANLGLFDQLEALRWVRRNIAAFGGDPERVTVFGQSAGGDAVAHLMATPDASGLFRRAIIQSAPFALARRRAAMVEAMNEAARGITADDSMQDVLDAQPAVEKAASGFGLRRATPFGTQYGQPPLPAEEDIDAAWHRHAPDVDVLIGHTAQEATLFVPRIPALQRLARLPLIGRVLSRGAVAALTRIIYGAGSRRFARRHARAGGSAHHYVVSWAAPGNPWRAAHTVDLPLLFGDEGTWQRADLVAGARWADLDAAAKRVREVWGRFARGEDLGDSGRVPGALSYHRVH
ncbi:carboxylesterase family protein [Microbacterium halophytorum]|uniref:carboxylesterase family protein n=1 Tax=Microbacterium halophytorum TaxID=2067568 RepID=UPI000CFCDB83|nr:carboxylesterase family protein [Microbacterium halophytorum]